MAKQITITRTARVSDADIRIAFYLSDIDPFPIMCSVHLTTDSLEDGVSSQSLSFPLADVAPVATAIKPKVLLVAIRDHALTLAGYTDVV